MPPAFNRATFYSTFVLMHNIADHFSPPNCPSHCNLPPKSDNNVLSTGEQGSEIFFFNKSWIFRGSLWNLSPWQRIGKGRPLPFNISTVQQSAELQKKSTSIEAEANNATTRAARSSEAEEELEFGENICVETRKDGWSCVVSLLHCVDCQPLTPYRDQQSFYQHRSPSRVDEYSRVNGTTRYPTAAIITRSLREFAGPSLQMDSLDINFINR